MANRRPRPVRRGGPVVAPEAATAATPEPANEAANREFRLFPATWNCWVPVFPALAMLFAAYYYWTASPCASISGVMQGECSPNRITGIDGKQIGPYNLLAESFLAGQVSLLIRPDPRLLQLPNPYDPKQNWVFRYHSMHDMSLYKGSFYSYFGPAPALLLFAPFRFIFGAYLPDAIGCAVLAIGAYLAACLALRLVLRTFFPTLPGWVFPFLAFGLGFCNTYPFLLRRPAMYEIAIAGGQLFLMGAVLLLGRAVLGASGHSLRDAAFGGVAAALAVASRPQLLLADAVLFLPILISPPAFDGQRRKVLVYALVPFMAAGLLLAWYNYARFDSPFEFGQHYELAGIDMSRIPALEMSRIPASLYFYLFCPVGLSSSFPFIQTTAHAPFVLPRSIVGLERITGILWLSPPLLSLLLTPWLWKQRQKDPRPVIWVLVLLGAALIVLFMDSSTGSPTMRYQADSSTLFFLAASVAIGWLLVSGPSRLRKHAVLSLIAMVSFGIVCNAAFGVSGTYDNLQRADPAQYKTLESFFQPVSQALGALGL